MVKWMQELGSVYIVLEHYESYNNNLRLESQDYNQHDDCQRDWNFYEMLSDDHEKSSDCDLK